MLSVLHVEFMSSAESVWYVRLSVMLGIFVAAVHGTYGCLKCERCMHFRPTKKSNFLENEIQLISLSFDLPWQKEEKQNSETHVPFAFFLNKTKNEFRIMHSFFLFLKETKKEFK